MKLLATIHPLAIVLSNPAFAVEDDIAEFGATSDDLADDTSATANAAVTCEKSDGSTVHCPDGDFSPSRRGHVSKHDSFAAERSHQPGCSTRVDSL